MFAVLAIVCFLLALLKVAIGSVDLVTLGLLFVACEMLFSYRPWNRGP